MICNTIITQNDISFVGSNEKLSNLTESVKCMSNQFDVFGKQLNEVLSSIKELKEENQKLKENNSKLYNDINDLNRRINSVEHIFVSLHLDNSYYIIGCAYIPPRFPINTYEKIFSAVTEVCNANPHANIILLGDFNLPSLVWSCNKLPTNCTSPIDSYFVSMLSYFCLSQYNLFANHNNNILDLILSNIHLVVTII